MSKKELLNIDKYCLITFPTTHSALHAEKVLEESQAPPFIIVPTPREISAGCGLAIRIFCEDVSSITGRLANNGIEAMGFYEVAKSQGKNTVIHLTYK